MKDIIVYTTNRCGYCNAAKMWLQNHGLDFKEINLDEGNESEKFMESYPHLRTSPQIFCDGENDSLRKKVDQLVKKSSSED